MAVEFMGYSEEYWRQKYPEDMPEFIAAGLAASRRHERGESAEREQRAANEAGAAIAAAVMDGDSSSTRHYIVGNTVQEARKVDSSSD